MMKSSRKGWTEPEEKLLVDTVDSFAGKGRSKKAAFEEVAAKINRSTATCSYHYYAIMKKKAEATDGSPPTLQDCIHFLKNMQQPDSLAGENEWLQKEKKELLHAQKELKVRYESLLKKQKKMQQLLSILKEAERYGEASSGPVIH
jgi:RsfA family transcription factor